MRLKPPRRRKCAIGARGCRRCKPHVVHTFLWRTNLADGRKIRLLTIVDNFSRERLALDVATGFKGTDVAQALTRIVAERKRPHQIRSSDGPEFVTKALDQWAYWNKAELDFQGLETDR